MECSCGGVISTNGEIVDEATMKTKYPNTVFENGYESYYVRFGTCQFCTRVAISVFPQKKRQQTLLTKLFNKPIQPVTKQPQEVKMSSNPLYDILTQLTECKGSNAKIDLIEKLKINSPTVAKQLSEYLQLVYGGHNWFQTKIVPAGRLACMGKQPVELIQGIRDYIAGPCRGDVGSSRLGMLHTLLKSDEDRTLLKFAMWGDIKVGIGPITINKIFPNLLFIPPYMRCDVLKKGHHLKWKWGDGVFIQKKEDAMFGNLLCRKDATESKLYSRSFNLIDSNNSLNNLKIDASRIWEEVQENCVIHGEIIVLDENGIPLTRELSNGAINGLIQTGTELREGYSVIMKAWDIVSENEFYAGVSTVHYRDRYSLLQDVMKETKSITIVETQIVTEMEQAVEMFSRILKEKGEGIVMKNPHGIWEDSDASPDQIKVKVEMVVELRIVGFNPADPKSKHKDTFASLQCESEDGLVLTGVSGMSDDKRMEIHLNREKFNQSIISVRCNGIQWNDEAPHSLYFAQFAEERLDKSIADDFIKIQDIQDDAIRNRLMSQAAK